MLKVDDRIEHYLYGKGTVLSILKDKDELLVSFDKEFEVLTGKVIDTDFYFEDTRRLETTRFIEVSRSNVEKINIKLEEANYFSKERNPYCHSCKKLISTVTHDKCKECGWIICDCGACGCNYKK